MKKNLQWMGMMLALTLLFLAGCSTTDGESSSANSNTNSRTGSNSASAQAEPQGETTSAPEIAELEQMEVTLYLPNESADGFEEKTETVEASPQGIVDALIAQGALPEGVVVNSFRTESNGTESQEGEVVSYQVGDTLTIRLDLSEEFSTGINSLGTSGEGMMLGSLVNTMLTAYHADALELTCNGAVLETGHNVYDAPISFMTIS